MKSITVLYASDDNYAGIMGVSIYSLLEQHKNVWVNIFVLDNHISQANKRVLLDMTHSKGGCTLNFEEYTDISECTGLDVLNDRSLSTYSRLMIQEIFPKDLKRVLYLDCDTLITDSLEEFYFSDMGNYILSACEDFVMPHYKYSIGMEKQDLYVNAGVLLIQLDRWRECEVEKNFLEFLKKYDGKVPHHDQGIINGVLAGKIKKAPLRYNAITPVFEFSYKQLCKLYRDTSISNDEVVEANKRPACVHFTPSYSGRPWFDYSRHPLRNKYRDCIEKSGLKNVLTSKDRRNWHTKIMMKLFSILPFRLFVVVCRAVNIKSTLSNNREQRKEQR